MKGLLLVNLGTPEQPTPKMVAKYLRQFLMDGRVIDIPAPLRWLLVHLFIAPFRSRSSAEAYSKIWRKEGSPLLVNTRSLTEKVQERVADDWKVSFGMRYGEPSLKRAVESLAAAGVDELWVIPLYPQYAMSSTVSSQEELRRQIHLSSRIKKVHFLQDFFDEPRFIERWATKLENAIKEFEPDHLLLSYHGVPVRHVKKTVSDPQICQVNENCCARVEGKNRKCYRAQCFATSGALIERLNWPSEQVTTSFQSRLGQSKWITPYTDFVIPELAKKRAVKRLLVACPSFTADCLETLEEIGLRARFDFEEAGGQAFQLVECLNDDDQWAQAVSDYPGDMTLAWHSLE